MFNFLVLAIICIVGYLLYLGFRVDLWEEVTKREFDTMKSRERLNKIKEKMEKKG